MNAGSREAAVQNRSPPIASLAVPVHKMSIVKRSDNHALAIGSVDAGSVAGEAAVGMISCLAGAVTLGVASDANGGGITTREDVFGCESIVGGAAVVDDFGCCRYFVNTFIYRGRSIWCLTSCSILSWCCVNCQSHSYEGKKSAERDDLYHFEGGGWIVGEKVLRGHTKSNDWSL